MTEPKELISLSDALEGDGSPDGARADIGRLQKLQERTLQNRTRLLDRHHQLPLYGKAREKAEESHKSRWKMAGCPSDHPLIQTILSLRADEDELVAMKSELEPKDYVRLKISLKQQITNVLLALQKENEKVYEEVMRVIEHDRRITEHDEKMDLARGKAIENNSDDELLKKAALLGIKIESLETNDEG